MMQQLSDSVTISTVTISIVVSVYSGDEYVTDRGEKIEKLRIRWQEKCGQFKAEVSMRFPHA